MKLNRIPILQAEEAKYLDLYLDRRLTWKKHICFTKRKALGLKFRNLYWLMNRNSQLSLENKLLLYKRIFKSIWSYGLQLWGTAANSNIDILQRFLLKVLHIIVDVTNERLHRELGIPIIREEIRARTMTYKERIQIHPNQLACRLMDERIIFRRLKRKAPQDLLK